MNLWIIFLTGLTTGGLSCLAMQGGLLAGVIANQKEAEIKKYDEKVLNSSARNIDWVPVILFLLAKIIVHTAFGFLLGWFGSKIELSLTTRLLFQIFAALFMLATAANLLNLHPIFRYLVFQPPKFVRNLIKDSSKSEAFFTPIVLGMLTIFIPCGVTQAMEVLAITSGRPMLGALIMFSFVMGTFPLFALIGVATAKLSETFKKSFLKVAAFSLIFMGLSSFNGVLTVIDSPITFRNLSQPIVYFFSEERFSSSQNDSLIVVKDGVQEVLIKVVNNGYLPNRVKVKAGTPVVLTLYTENSYSCANFFVFNEFNINMQLSPNDRQSAVFTPNKKGTYLFSCSMGMYTGTLEVI